MDGWSEMDVELLIGRTQASLGEVEKAPEKDAFVANEDQEGLRLSNTVQHRWVWVNVSAKGASFVNCDFSYTTFVNCYFRDASFKDCDFTGCRFVDCNLATATLVGCRFAVHKMG